MKGVDTDILIKRFKIRFDTEEEAEEKKLNGHIGFVVVNEMLVNRAPNGPSPHANYAKSPEP